MAATSTAYRNALKQLYLLNVYNPVKMGLENIWNLHTLLGRPMQGMPVVHIGGTNGKGSVCYKAAAALQQGGCKVGLFVSPHISSFRERVQVNGQALSEEDVLVRIYLFEVILFNA